jgi:hypothetical protein
LSYEIALQAALLCMAAFFCYSVKVFFSGHPAVSARVQLVCIALGGLSFSTIKAILNIMSPLLQ